MAGSSAVVAQQVGVGAVPAAAVVVEDGRDRAPRGARRPRRVGPAAGSRRGVSGLDEEQVVVDARGVTVDLGDAAAVGQTDLDPELPAGHPRRLRVARGGRPPGRRQPSHHRGREVAGDRRPRVASARAGSSAGRSQTRTEVASCDSMSFRGASGEATHCGSLRSADVGRPVGEHTRGRTTPPAASTTTAATDAKRRCVRRRRPAAADGRRCRSGRSGRARRDAVPQSLRKVVHRASASATGVARRGGARSAAQPGLGCGAS